MIASPAEALAARYVSTRGASPALPFSAALGAGLAADGGLYVPERLPGFDPAGLATIPDTDLAGTLAALLRPLLGADDLTTRLEAICGEAASFDIPLLPLRVPGDHWIELFHGPTAAFKDLAARFLAASLATLRTADAPPQTVLVATSGDTGAAVGAAFHGRAGFRVLILYPDGKVSPAQTHSLGAFGGNVRALRVAGSFDDCQRLVKAALGDARLRADVPLLTANSISLGRLLPQMAWPALHALRFQRRHGHKLNFIIPSGNLGHALAVLFARAMGLPIGEVMLATNANPTLAEFFEGAPYRGRDAIPTLANAMDVGAPSNVERLLWLAGGDAAVARSLVGVRRIDDARIRTTIAAAEARHGVAPCPHSACGLAVLEDLRSAGDRRDWAVTATAHAGKFLDVTGPLLASAPAPPPAFAALLARPSHAMPLAVDVTALGRVLREDWG
ncbi:threonine synthase [Silanimonas sp.]|uniref:threonine synthase n=1 Tax=Silanimonas sp. TaxID=1929290 RepID=UPI001BBA4936|nr:threonine synthase [Silanimonas sp.]MBS3895650.1 threonine synthase [Silanimonas sp.]MBS3925062.1 threonine synthase [Xanthomonadaceae bacterium]